MSSGESRFIKIDSLKDRLNALFSLHEIERSLKLLLLSLAIWSDFAHGLHATLFPAKGDELICSPDLTFKWRSVLP